MVYFTFATQFIIRHLGGSECKLLRNISTIPFRDPEVRQTCENKYERYVACLGNLRISGLIPTSPNDLWQRTHIQSGRCRPLP